MSAQGELAPNAPVAVNISMATGSATPALCMLPTRKSPDRTLVVPLVGVMAHCKSRRRNVAVWSSGVAASTASLVAFAQVQRGEQHGIDGDQHNGRDADGENHLDQRERVPVVHFNFHYRKLMVAVGCAGCPGWVCGFASVLNFTE